MNEQAFRARILKGADMTIDGILDIMRRSGLKSVEFVGPRKSLPEEWTSVLIRETFGTETQLSLVEEPTDTREKCSNCFGTGCQCGGIGYTCGGDCCPCGCGKKNRVMNGRE